MDCVVNTLHEQVLKLIPIKTRLNTLEKHLQQEIVLDVFRGYSLHASMLGNELAVIRKVYRLVGDLKSIHETVIERIGTTRDYTEFYNTINSMVTCLTGVQDDLTRNMLSARRVSADMSDPFSDRQSMLCVKQKPYFGIVTDDGLEILEEVSSTVEEFLKCKFGVLPEIEQEKKVLVNL